MQLSQKQKIFSQFSFFFAFSKFRLAFENFQKNVTIIADIFLNLGTPKNAVRKMSKKSCFRGPFEK